DTIIMFIRPTAAPNNVIAPTTKPPILNPFVIESKAIGIRKALGATPTRIRQQFLIEAIVICQLGGIVGALLGIAVGNVLANILGGAFVIPWVWITVSLFICVFVGLISGFIPANKASKLDPIDALRFE
uniref:ABC transporter permease n=1 Tax=Roseivirga sp. TaxID=1964215 RepID=UPI004048C4A7